MTIFTESLFIMGVLRTCVVMSFLISVVFYRYIECQDILFEESEHMESIHAPSGGRVELPCDVTTSLEDDRMVLVIWYKQGHHAPIFTFDSREESTSYWSDPLILGQRATFRSDSIPATLILNKLRPEDSGQYRCRVDFIKSPTKNTRLNLTVLIPPERLLILDNDLEEIRNGVIGPYDEGKTVQLVCLAVGGRPTPRVSWWKTHELLANSETRASINFTLQRSDLGTEITCQAVTDPSIPPLSKVLTIVLNLRPLLVRIQGNRRPLIANQSVELVCQVIGARPKPSISWWKDGVRLKTIRETVSPDANITSSILTFTPVLEDNGRVISCRAIQTSMAHSTQEDGFKMEIQHIPLPKLQLGTNINSSNIVEGYDIYLDCKVRANPPHSHVYFTHNDIVVKAGPGIILANQSLVLQKVLRKAAGEYKCIARNSLGNGSSEALVLNIKYVPTCLSSQTKVLRAAKGDKMEIECKIDANPKDGMSVDWWFNSSTHSKNELVTSSSESNPELFQYVVNTSADYGWVQCFGTNSVGRQTKPCSFHILPADKPSSVKSCEISNVTYDSLIVNCLAAHDGGLRQYFSLEVFDMRTGTLLGNMTNDKPEFHVSGLKPSNTLSILIRAFNKKGSSEPCVLTTTLLKYPEKHTAQMAVKVELAPILMIVLCAIGVAAFIMALSALVYCITYAIKKNRATNDKNLQNEPSNTPLTGSNDTKSIDSVEKNPDIIPIDCKISGNDSVASTTTDHSSTRPLISKYLSEDSDFFPPPDGPFGFSDAEENSHSFNQFIQIRPMEYRSRPILDRSPSFGHLLAPMPNLVRMVPECHVRQARNKIYEDRLKFDGIPLNCGVPIQSDQSFHQQPLYTHQVLRETPNTELQYSQNQIPNLDISHNWPESPSCEETDHSSSNIRFGCRNESIYFNKVSPSRHAGVTSMPQFRGQTFKGSTYNPQGSPSTISAQEQIITAETNKR